MLRCDDGGEADKTAVLLIAAAAIPVWSSPIGRGGCFFDCYNVQKREAHLVLNDEIVLYFDTAIDKTLKIVYSVICIIMKIFKEAL